MDRTFQFALGSKVAVTCSGETGEVMGRAEYSNSTNSYLVRYQSADGRAVEAWWQEDALLPAA